MSRRITQQQLESYLWGAAVLLRGTIDAGDYKQFIFPLLFFKRLCDVFDEETLLALKAGLTPHIEMAQMKGLIAFPSFHTVMAVLTVYAAAAVPRGLWPVVMWNAIVLLSVPVDGGHHVVDIAAGLVLAAAAIMASERICCRLARSDGPIAWPHTGAATATR